MTPESIGFRELTHSRRGGLESCCAEFLAEKHEKPFFLVASFINPHDICYMGIDDARDHEEKAKKKEKKKKKGKVKKKDKPRSERHPELAKAMRLPSDVSESTFFERLCPPLPANFEVPTLEPEAVQTHYIEAKSFRDYMRRNWDQRQWRLHRWAYCRLTESVDAQIGVVLAALRKAGLEDQTLIVFSSDHGDMDASHRLGHKQVLYEEAARVPFLVSYKGITKPGLVDTEHLVASGLDLMPTLCDYAGIAVPPGLHGRSVRPLAEGRQPDQWRDELVVESCFGRTLCTDRFKYVVYADGRHREQLIDLATDPGEMQNLAEDPKYQGPLDEHRARLRRWVEQTGDSIARPWLAP
jgi:choline-sulfatase